MEMGKNTIFLSPINFLTSFSVTSRKKNWTRGENIILFLIKLISKKLSSAQILSQKKIVFSVKNMI
jgi:hypothetical protein